VNKKTNYIGFTKKIVNQYTRKKKIKGGWKR